MQICDSLLEWSCVEKAISDVRGVTSEVDQYLWYAIMKRLYQRVKLQDIRSKCQELYFIVLRNNAYP